MSRIFPSVTRLVIALFLLLVLPTILLAQNPGDQLRTITIDEAVDIALAGNLNIALAQSRVETSQVRVTGAFGTFLPQISVTGGYSRQLSAEQNVIVGGVQIPIERPDNNYNASASASLLLFDGFSRTAEYSSARALYNAAIETYGRTRQQIEFQTRTAYLSALRAEQIIEIRRQDLDVARDRLQRSKQQVEVGVATVAIVYTAEADVADAELMLEQATGDALSARTNLALLLNIDPALSLQLTGQGLANSVDSTEIAANRSALGNLEVLYNQQMTSRRDLQAARLNVEAAEARTQSARSGYWPSVGTSLTYSWQKAGPGEPSTGTSFGLNFQYAAFDGFRTTERVQLAEADMQSARIDMQRLTAQARSELRGAWVRLESAERQIRAAEKSLAAARRSRYAADERFRLGAGAEADYLLANARYISAQINQLNAVFNYRMVLYEIRYHAGL